MAHVDYPATAPKTKTENGKRKLWCAVRKKWLQLTPEEWVRQNFILFLTEVLHYPLSWLSVEKKVQVGELTQRFDIVVYKNSQPWMLIECKEPTETLSPNTFLQALRYFSTMQGEYICLTNGGNTLLFQRESAGFNEIIHFPIWRPDNLPL